MAMVLVEQMTNVLAIIELTVNPRGQILTAPEELAHNPRLGLGMLKTQTTHTQLLNVQTRVSVTDRQENVSASQTMMELHVSAQFAPTDAVMLEFALHKCNWLLKLVVCIQLLGMQQCRWDVCAILVDVVLIAHCLNVHLVPMF